MSIHQVTVGLPETLYLRLQRTAQATRQTLADVLLRVVQVGSPPGWEDAPPNFREIWRRWIGWMTIRSGKLLAADRLRATWCAIKHCWTRMPPTP